MNWSRVWSLLAGLCCAGLLASCNHSYSHDDGMLLYSPVGSARTSEAVLGRFVHEDGCLAIVREGEQGRTPVALSDGARLDGDRVVLGDGTSIALEEPFSAGGNASTDLGGDDDAVGDYLDSCGFTPTAAQTAAWVDRGLSPRTG